MPPVPNSRKTGLPEGLRAAIRSEAYEEVPRLLAEYNCWLEQALAQAANDPGETRGIVAEARDLLRWAKAAVSASRAHAQARLSRIDHAARYRPAWDRNSGAWRVQA